MRKQTYISKKKRNNTKTFLYKISLNRHERPLNKHSKIETNNNNMTGKHLARQMFLQLFFTYARSKFYRSVCFFSLDLRDFQYAAKKNSVKFLFWTNFLLLFFSSLLHSMSFIWTNYQRFKTIQFIQQWNKVKWT